MTSRTVKRLVVIAGFILANTVVHGERADAVYRDGVMWPDTAGGDYHAALVYRYNGDTAKTEIIHSAGGGNHAANSVRVDSWSNFLAGHVYQGKRCKSNLSKGVRDAIINDALDQLNAYYWWISILPWQACWMSPNSSPGSGDGCFRCDALVEWCYEQNGQDICNDALLFTNGPDWQMSQMPDATQTAPASVAMTYPTSSSQSNPTKTSSTAVTFSATASDTHSGLAYNKPYWYNVSWKRCDGLWDATVVKGGSSLAYTLQRGLLYGVSVAAVDNGGVNNSANSTSSGFYYIACPFVVSSSPGSGGSISPNGNTERMCNESVSFSASPNSCYTVDKWYVNGSAVQTGGNSYTLSSIQADRTVQVTFKQVTYSILCSASPSGGGLTGGCGTKTCGSSVTVTATPNSCYTFASWTEGGTVVSTSPNYSFTASGNRTLVANFTQTTYTINTSSSPSGGGTTSGGGSKGCGSSVTVTATPAYCYQFVNWTEGGIVVSTSASYTFTVGGGRNLVANFIVPNYSISTSSSPSGGGITSGGGSFSCGSSATVVATPNSCYTFANWTEGGTVVSTSPSYSFTATANRSLVANFNLINYTINTSSSPSAGGTTSGGGLKGCGSSVTLTATPASCYQFVNWTEGGAVVSTSSSYSFSASGNRTLVANFTPITYSVSTSSSPGAGGSTSGGGTVNCGSSVTVSASANTGYRFVNWTEGGTIVSASPSYTFTSSGNRALVANFTATYTIAASSSPGAGGATSGSGTYDSGSSVILTATPSSCYQFVNWTESAAVVSTAASYTFTATGSWTLVANFSQINYTINASASPSGGGTTSGGGTKTCGSAVTVTATPNSCYTFANWTEGGTVVSTSPSYSFTASGNRTLVANFTQTTYTINTSSLPSGGGTTSGGGSRGCGSSVTVTATPSSCYQFVNWAEAGTVVSTSASYTFTAAGNRNLVANFTVPTYTITTSSSPSAGGTTAGGGSKGCGTTATVTASANAGYSFINWTESGVEVSTLPSYTFTVAVNRALTANFACISSITPNGGSHGQGADTGTVTVSAGATCDWTATSNDSWLHITCGSSGTGPGTVCYSVDSNVTNCIGRTGTLTIIGHTFTVTQAAGSGSYTINPASRTVTTDFATGTITVSAGAGCTWTARSGVAWVAVIEGASGTGNGIVSYLVADNNSSTNARSTVLDVAGKSFTISQDGVVCVYSLSAASTNLAYRNGAGSFAVTTQGICGWSASSLDSWINTSSAGGGNGPVSFTVDENTGGTARSGSIAVADKVYTVNQDYNHPPQITAPPTVTNAVVHIGSMAVVVAGETNVFTVGAVDPDGDPMTYRWEFGGNAATSTYAYAAAVCSNYLAGVTVSSGTSSSSAPLTVMVACQLDIASLQVKLNFAKANADGCALKAMIDSGVCAGLVGKSVTVDVGGAQVSFTLDAKGRGVNGNGTCRFAYNSKAGACVVSLKLKGGDWRNAWAKHGLTNETILKPGKPVTLPVIIVVGDEAFMGEKSLPYTASQGKSGSAK